MADAADATEPDAFASATSAFAGASEPEPTHTERFTDVDVQERSENACIVVLIGGLARIGGLV